MTRVACTLALLGLAACGDDAPPLFADPPKAEVATFPAAPARQLDLLFVIDDSTGMDGPQRALAEQLPVLFGHLAVLPGGLPDLHIGVTTTDLGTTGSGDPETPGPAIGTAGSGGCAGSGKDGALVANGAPITGAYVIDEAAGIDRERNYTGELADVVSTMLKVGAGGCGFEQPLHAVRRALSNPANAGFLRADAQLAIVVVSDEDDCSFADAGLVDPDDTSLGPFLSYRCTREGIVCDQPIDEVGDKTGCRSNEASAYLEPVGETLAFLDGFKPDRSMLTLSAIAGELTPFSIELRGAPGSTEVTPQLAHSCSYLGPMGPYYADPGVRLHEVVEALDGRGALGSVCRADYAPAVHAIARTITPAFGVTCLDTTHLADESTEPGIQPRCEVSVEQDGTATPLPACATDGDVDCFALAADAEACPETIDHLRLVTRFAGAPPAGAYVRARCEPWPPR